MWSRYARGGARHTTWAIRGRHIALVLLAARRAAASASCARRSLLLACILAAALTSTAVHMLVVSQARYNLPLMPALLAGGVAGWVMFVRGQRRAGRERPISPPQDLRRESGQKLAFGHVARVASRDATDRPRLPARLLGPPAAASAAVTPTRDAGVLVRLDDHAERRPGRRRRHRAHDHRLSGNPAADRRRRCSAASRSTARRRILTSGDADGRPRSGPGRRRDATRTAEPSTAEPRTPRTSSILRVDLDVPQRAPTASPFGFRFLTEEYPEIVGLAVQRRLHRRARHLDVDGRPAATDHGAESNFAFDRPGEVDQRQLEPGDGQPARRAGAAGTGYDGARRGSAPPTPVTPGRTRCTCRSSTRATGSYDSAVFVDRISLLRTEAGGCVRRRPERRGRPAVA